MSYPDPVYLGDTGEVSARLRPSDAPHDITYPNGTTCDYLATGASTGGRFGLYRWTMAAGAGGPGLHFHRSISESFFVLSGTVLLQDGEQDRKGRPGDFLYVPEGGLHGFANASADEPASMLILFSPGAPREGYFEGLLALAKGATMSDEEKDAFFLAHDNVWV